MSEIIVMVHGMWVGSWCWDKYRTYFENQGYRCITPTLRFHDMIPTDLPDLRLGKLSNLDYAQDLENEIIRLEQKPVIMGHSLGGLLTQILVSRGLAKAAVLLVPVPPRGISNLAPSVIKMSFCRETLSAASNKPFKLPFSKISYGVLNLLPIKEQKEQYSRYVFESGKVSMEMNAVFDVGKASKVDKTMVNVPLSIIGAKKDRATPVSIVRKIAKRYAGVCTYKEFDGHAHWIIGEPGWQDVADYIDGWLKTI
jgi:pimeloyl-ACP methyl ester carboxylesterase